MMAETVGNCEAMGPVGASLVPAPFLPASCLWRHPGYRLVCTTGKIALA
ncbi:MAG: hypothetical protein IJ658_12880 [Kiritimatiellae bacterium]|nr:hypothetical protein [Kiritimatiellia bacterium]